MRIANAGERHDELELSFLDGLVSWGLAISDRAPPLPQNVPAQSQGSFQACEAGLQGAWSLLPLPWIFRGRLPEPLTQLTTASGTSFESFQNDRVSLIPLSLWTILYVRSNTVHCLDTLQSHSSVIARPFKTNKNA